MAAKNGRHRSRAATPVALVTGGARRVGRAIALALADAGYDIALHFRSSRKEAKNTAALIEDRGRCCALLAADLADESSWEPLVVESVAACGRLDVLVNNASEFDPRPPGRRASERAFNAAEWERMFRVNTTAPAALCHYARSHLAAGGRGRIINLCDIAAERPWPGHLSYCCSKAALVTLTRGLARLYAPDITVNGISPGIAEFPSEYPAPLRRKLIGEVPLKRAGTPAEVAALARFLAAEGDYITGQIIAIDGGRSLA
jgi:pteridine reductase